MNKYEIMDIIDEGAYGIVWKALNKETNQLTAIKEFKESDEDETTRKTIAREIKMLKMLKGEYVVGLKEAFKKKGKIYLIFEYFDYNLLNLIEKFETGLEAELIRKIIYKATKCVMHLHSKNILHRDIKPENLLISRDYTLLKLCDFGFARFLPENPREMTDYVATRWYRSPELLIGTQYGKPSDVWALGSMLGELVDGEPMFPGKDELDQLHLVRKALGNFTKEQENTLKLNPKYEGIELPVVKTTEPLEMRYLGKIQKNALLFMKDCLKVDPDKRITIEEALKHPYLLPLSTTDNYFSNDEQNLLKSERAIPIAVRQSQHQLQHHNHHFPIVSNHDNSTNEGPIKTKFFGNKNSLKLQGASMPQNLIYNTEVNQIRHLKKNSQVNLHHNEHIVPKQIFKQLSPKLKVKQDVNKKMMKMLSEEKNLNVNFDINVNINLKLHKKSLPKDQKDKSITRVERQVEAAQRASRLGKLPEIKNSTKGMKYLFSMKQQHDQEVELLHKASSRNLAVLGESKELSKGAKKSILF